MRARASIAIDRPAAEVFAHVADFGSHPSWRPELSFSGSVGEPGVGMRIYQSVSIQGRDAQLELDVTEWVAPERITFRYEGPPRARGGFLLRPEGAGTRLTVYVSVVLDGRAGLVEDRIKQSAESEASHSLARLKALVEHGARG